MASNRIETLIDRREWKSAQSVIQKELATEPDDHWLWSRLSGVKYEQRKYPGALEAAKRALEIVPDCPLALWSCASALEELGRTGEAGKIYLRLLRRGLEELKQPDDDADECWEGADWTRRLVVDCIFCIAGCLAKLGKAEEAVEWYQRFLDLLDYGMPPGIYSREDATARLKKLGWSEKAKLDAIERRIKALERVLQ